MALPKLASITYKTTLISDENREVEYRPFLAKEQKMLLMAIESGSATDISNSVYKILQSCIVTEDIDLDSLPPFDVEHLFLEIRKHSIGEKIELRVKHPETDHTNCLHSQEITVDLNNVTINRPEGHVKKFKIDDEIGVVMRYPTMKTVEKFSNVAGKTNAVKTFDLIASCIESVYDSNTVYTDFSLPEIISWVEQLNNEQLKKISSFFYTMPELSYDIHYTCQGCGQPVSYTLRGIRDFFM